MASSTTNEKVGVGEQDPQNQKNLQNPQNGEELGTPATESTEQTAEPEEPASAGPGDGLDDADGGVPIDQQDLIQPQDPAESIVVSNDEPPGGEADEEIPRNLQSQDHQALVYSPIHDMLEGLRRDMSVQASLSGNRADEDESPAHGRGPAFAAFVCDLLTRFPASLPLEAEFAMQLLTFVGIQVSTLKDEYSEHWDADKYQLNVGMKNLMDSARRSEERAVKAEQRAIKAEQQAAETGRRTEARIAAMESGHLAVLNHQYQENSRYLKAAEAAWFGRNAHLQPGEGDEVALLNKPDLINELAPSVANAAKPMLEPLLTDAARRFLSSESMNPVQKAILGDPATIPTLTAKVAVIENGLRDLTLGEPYPARDPNKRENDQPMPSEQKDLKTLRLQLDQLLEGRTSDRRETRDAVLMIAEGAGNTRVGLEVLTTQHANTRDLLDQLVEASERVRILARSTYAGMERCYKLLFGNDAYPDPDAVITNNQ